MSGSNYTQTPNLGLFKPAFNADVGAWGGHWNSNADTLDSVISGLNSSLPFVRLAGSTMTGPLILSGDPTSALQAATKSYADSQISAAVGAYLPLAGGTLTGALTLSANPTTGLQAATKQYVDTSLPVGGPYLPTAGGTLTGALLLSGDPTTALQAATRQYADTKLALAGGTMVGALTLNADPTTALQAATKQYVDTSLPVGGPFLPTAGGTMVGALTLNADPTTALQAATRQYADTKLALAGGTMTGLLTLSGAPTNTLHAATKTYVDTRDALNLPLTGGTLTGSLFMTYGKVGAPATTAQVVFDLDNNGSQARYIRFLTAGGSRWFFGAATAETGSGNTGSDIIFNRFDDTGAYINTPFSITRATGLVGIAGGLNVGGGITLGSQNAASVTDLSKHIAFFGTTFGLNVTSNRLNAVVPSTSGFYVNVGGTDRLSVTNTTITATVPIALPADPTTALQAATKQYADTKALMVGKSGAAPPVAADIPAGQFTVWKNTADSSVRIYYNDGGTMRSAVLT